MVGLSLTRQKSRGANFSLPTRLVLRLDPLSHYPLLSRELPGPGDDSGISGSDFGGGNS